MWQEAEGTAIVSDVRTELTTVLTQVMRTRDKNVRRELRSETKRLRKEIREREEKVVTGLLRAADVICTTNVGAASRVLQRVFGGGDSGDPAAPALCFDLVVVDEAAQAIEASCYIPVLMGSRLVLAGDHMQVWGVWGVRGVWGGVCGVRCVGCVGACIFVWLGMVLWPPRAPLCARNSECTTARVVCVCSCPLPSPVTAQRTKV